VFLIQEEQMARDYENIFHLDDLDDNELRRLVRETLRDNRSIDPDDIRVHIREGKVILAGRVGTEAEKRIAERVIEDRIGVERFESQLVVDPIRRAESPEAIDEHLADEEAHEGLLLGEGSSGQNDEARHLADDFEGEMTGTVDREESVERGIPWIPPESPTPEGYGGTGIERDAGSDAY
jgi:hypothetical protein